MSATKLTPAGCKMDSGHRYASDADCDVCGLGEGEACKAYIDARDARLEELRNAGPVIAFPVGTAVRKVTGDYQIDGEVRAVFTTKTGKVRYVVEHEPGFLHIYSDANLRAKVAP